MTLILQIENYDMLEDGGPAQFTVSGRNAEVGRARTRDWVLPDPTKHISGHHFNILFQDGAYFLQDVSTNGTFLQGNRYRLEQPHRLNTGDRFQVGPYFIAVHVQDMAQPAMPVQADTWAPNAPTQPPVQNNANADPWDMGGPAAAVEVTPPAPTGRREDFADDFIVNPVSLPPTAPLPDQDEDPFALPPKFNTAAAGQSAGIQLPSHMTTPPQPLPVQALTQPPVAPAQPAPSVAPPPEPIAPAAPQFAAAPPASPNPEPSQQQHMPTPAPRPDTAQMARPEPVTPTPQAPVTGNQSADFVRAFCEAAGIAPDAYVGVDGVELARALGTSTRHIAGELMALLRVRDAAKQFTRGGERTMRRNADNNPLKFLPDADQAIEAMYLKHRAGFLNGPDGIAEALRDVRVHQTAVFAAIQPALAQLLQDLSPEEIEKEASSSASVLSGGKRTKAWDTFVERWDSKASSHDNGMLGEFLEHFAKAYAEVVGSETR